MTVGRWSKWFFSLTFSGRYVCSFHSIVCVGLPRTALRTYCCCFNEHQSARLFWELSAPFHCSCSVQPNLSAWAVPAPVCIFLYHNPRLFVSCFLQSKDSQMPYIPKSICFMKIVSWKNGKKRGHKVVRLQGVRCNKDLKSMQNKQRNRMRWMQNYMKNSLRMCTSFCLRGLRKFPCITA